MGMSEDTKESIHAVLTLLKSALVKNGVSIGLVGNEIMFFDTTTYLKERKFNGMKVSINDLVNQEKKDE